MTGAADPTARLRRRIVTSLSRRKPLRAALATVLVVSTWVAVTVAVPALLPQARADQPVSGAFALGGGVGGGIDPRTGQFSVSVPLVTVASRGDSSVSLTLGWDQARAGAGLDRLGFGGGWGLGTTFIETQGAITVYPASGGAYTTDDTFASGLHDYPLEDLTFAFADGTLPARAGVSSPVAYSYSIATTAALYQAGSNTTGPLTGALLVAQGQNAVADLPLQWTAKLGAQSLATTGLTITGTTVTLGNATQYLPNDKVDITLVSDGQLIPGTVQIPGG
jgi:hypothetical protein